MRGATVVDTVMTLPPSGRGYNSNGGGGAGAAAAPSPSSGSTFVGSPGSTLSSGSSNSNNNVVLQTFGTMPR